MRDRNKLNFFFFNGQINFFLTALRIKLEYPDEYLESVSEHYFEAPWIVGEPVVIRSLKFESNRRTFGPVGDETGTQLKMEIKLLA